MSVVRSELITAIAEKVDHLPKSTVDTGVKLLFDLISDSVCDGERVEIRDFGRFVRRRHEERRSRNPKTGESLITPTKYTVHFKAGKKLRECVNDAAKKNKKKARKKK